MQFQLDLDGGANVPYKPLRPASWLLVLKIDEVLDGRLPVKIKDWCEYIHITYFQINSYQLPLKS